MKALIAFGLMLWMAMPANAIGMCGKRADFIKALNDKYSETAKHLAITGQVNLVEVYTSPAGTFTILFTTPQGRACVIAAGNGWEDLPIEIEGKNL